MCKEVMIYYKTENIPKRFENVTDEDIEYWEKDSDVLFVVNPETGEFIVDNNDNPENACYFDTETGQLM